jgi:hypothetical protein
VTRSNDPGAVRDELINFFNQVRNHDTEMAPKRAGAPGMFTWTLADLESRINDALWRYDRPDLNEIFTDPQAPGGVNYRLKAAVLATAAIPWSHAVAATLDGDNLTNRPFKFVMGPVRDGALAGVDIIGGRPTMTFTPRVMTEPLEQVIPVMIHEPFHQDNFNVSKIEEKIATTAELASYL